jgi:hypothetical protein
MLEKFYKGEMDRCFGLSLLPFQDSQVRKNIVPNNSWFVIGFSRSSRQLTEVLFHL